MSKAIHNSQDELNKLAEIIGGKPWGYQKNLPRIYMDAKRRDAKVFFAFPDWTFGQLGGATLMVYVDDCGQSAQWYESQKQQIRDRFRNAFLALAAGVENLELAKRLMTIDSASFSETDFDTIGHALVNGRPEIVGAILDEIERQGDA